MPPTPSSKKAADPGIVGLRLSQAREALGISQRELGLRAGLDISVASPRINQYERGTHAPKVSMLRALSAVLGCPVPFFFAEDDATAELLWLYGRASTRKRRACVEALR